MKGLKKYLFYGFVTLSGCGAPIDPHAYSLIIYKEDYNNKTKHFEPKIYTSKIKCDNDEIAYRSGFSDYYIRIKGEKSITVAVGKTDSFIVKDSNGIDLRKKLSLRTTDSIETYVKATFSQLFPQLK